LPHGELPAPLVEQSVYMLMVRSNGVVAASVNTSMVTLHTNRSDPPRVIRSAMLVAGPLAAAVISAPWFEAWVVSKMIVPQPLPSGVRAPLDATATASWATPADAPQTQRTAKAVNPVFMRPP